jgi:hypothetical protein
LGILSQIGGARGGNSPSGVLEGERPLVRD